MECAKNCKGCEVGDPEYQGCLSKNPWKLPSEEIPPEYDGEHDLIFVQDIATYTGFYDHETGKWFVWTGDDYDFVLDGNPDWWMFESDLPPIPRT